MASSGGHPVLDGAEPQYVKPALHVAGAAVVAAASAGAQGVLADTLGVMSDHKCLKSLIRFAARGTFQPWHVIISVQKSNAARPIGIEAKWYMPSSVWPI